MEPSNLFHSSLPLFSIVRTELTSTFYNLHLQNNVST